MIQPSQVPFSHDLDDNVVRAADGQEVCRFPTRTVYPIDRANGHLICTATQFYYKAVPLLIRALPYVKIAAEKETAVPAAEPTQLQLLVKNIERFTKEFENEQR